MPQELSLYIFPTLLIVAAVSDCMSLRIPNWLTILIAVCFFPMAWAAQMPMAEFGWHLVAGVSLFFAGWAIFELGIFGGGDAKLMAAAGLWLGTAKLIPFLFLTALAGGVMALAIMIWSAIIFTWELELDAPVFKSVLQRFKSMSPSLPYGLAFAVGGIIAFKDTWWFNGMG